ncbi:MAG: hypothetical protein HP498_05880 [Nitrospira sp.]|nr:hypothetical protein [Nitrospira sp.]
MQSINNAPCSTRKLCMPRPGRIHGLPNTANHNFSRRGSFLFRHVSSSQRCSHFLHSIKKRRAYRLEAAEQLRIRRLTVTTPYVILEPCAMCAGAIVQSRIARLVFGAWDPKAGACGSIFDIPAERRLNHHVEVTGGVLERESQALLQNFFRPKRQGTASKHDHRS